MTLNNYEKTLLRAESVFLDYDQERMLREAPVKADESYLYITFCYAPYRIHRKTGHVEALLADGGSRDADFSEGMSIFDFICDITPFRCLSQRMVSVDYFTNTSFTGTSLYQPYADFFDENPQKLAEVCLALTAKPWGKGDVSMELMIFDDFPVVLQFWCSEEDIPASLSLLWDANSRDYLRFESMHYCMGHLLNTIKKAMSQQDESR